MTRVHDEEYQEVLAEETFVLDAQVELHKVMNELGINQMELAERLGVSKSYISQIFGSTPRNLSMRTYAKIMHRLGRKATIGQELSMSIIDKLQDKNLAAIVGLQKGYHIQPIDYENEMSSFKVIGSWTSAHRTANTVFEYDMAA